MEGEHMKMLDAHIHLDFYDDINTILQTIQKNEIQAVFVTHLPELFEQYQSQMALYPNISLALGYHPILVNVYELQKQLFLKLKDSATFIGEVGLDYSITSSQRLRAKQRDAFTFVCKNVDNQVLSIHSRRAEVDVLHILKENGVKNAIFHWYTGSETLIADILAQGYFFSVNPMMLRSTKGIDILKNIPLNRLLIETDGPFGKYKGQIVSPTHLKSVYKDFSDFYKINNIFDIVWNNYCSLVNKNKRNTK